MKLIFLNGSRGEWGYIKPIIDICKEKSIEYSICATNMLLLQSHGNLQKEIVDAGYNVKDQIYMSLEGHNHLSMAKSLGVFMSSFVDSLAREKPDWIICAGDRGEQLMATICGSYTYIPVAHIQAGERSGNIDGVARHAIGKLAHLHFAANKDAEDRLLKSGEEQFRVHNVGAPQLDEMVKETIPDIKDTLSKLSVPLNKEYLLCVYHPVTEEISSSYQDMEDLIIALDKINLLKIFILPNNDAGSYQTRKSIIENRKSDMYLFDNLTRKDYLSLLKNCSAIVGNSSSGLLEAPTFKIPALNIGRRQKNRMQGLNVINCSKGRKNIGEGLKKVLSKRFKANLVNIKNPYGDGQSSERIIKILENTKIDSKLLIKQITY